jgi:uncharacterized protein (TIGR03067 family)
VLKMSLAVAQEKTPDKVPAKDDKSPDSDELKRAEHDLEAAAAEVELAKAQLGAAQARYRYYQQILEKLRKKSKEGKKAPAPAAPAGKTALNNAKKEPDVLIPEEAIRQRSKEKLAVQQGANKAKPELRGIWVAESVMVNGQQEKGFGRKIAFVGGKYLDAGRIFPDSGTFVLGREPMALDLLPTQPPPAESRESRRKASDPAPAGSPDQYGTLRCIYELKGDTLRICSAQTSADVRPTDFTAGPGSKRVYVVYRRLRP